MLIIAGYVEVDPERRDAYVAAHLDLVRRGRQAPGCLDFAITADPVSASRVYTFERWESRPDLDAWRAVAAPPESDIEFTTVAVMEYGVAGERPPFG